jgi:hypothetical protein
MVAASTLALGVAVGGWLGGIQPASAHERIPDSAVRVDGIDKHCESLHGWRTEPWLETSTADGWRCHWKSILNFEQIEPVNMQALCSECFEVHPLYRDRSLVPLSRGGRPGDFIFAQARSAADPFSWECWHHRDGHPQLVSVL